MYEKCVRVAKRVITCEDGTRNHDLCIYEHKTLEQAELMHFYYITL